MRLPLRTGWQLQPSCQMHATGARISSPDFRSSRWHSTAVPSTVLAALVADDTYPDPYFGMNLRNIPGTTYPLGANFANLPMPKDSPFACPWWYRTEFSLPRDFQGRDIWLHFDGINYRANLWVNGRKLADSSEVAGAFRIYSFNVTRFLFPGRKNTLAVEIFAPTERDLAMNFVDWNPMPPDKDMGLWGDVYLTASGPVALRYPQVVTRFPDRSLDVADLTVTAEVRNAASQPVNAVVAGTLEGIHLQQKVALAPGEVRAVTFSPAQYPQLRVAHPQVWWPYGLGPQTLHTLVMRVIVAGALSDRQAIRFGIRQITSGFNREGYRLFRINGRRILIRGGGWAPDMLLRQSPRRLEAQFDYVRQMGLNTIRLEGKLAEPEAFFDLADQRGVLIMAGWCCCSFWEHWKDWKPRDLAIATAQLRSQILRLRSHPSLLVWLNGSDNPPPAWVERSYIKVLQEEDWPNPYLSSASQQPTSVTGPSGVKMTGPYDYVSPEYWLEPQAKKFGGAWGFITETSPGAAPPPASSLRRMMPADAIWPPNESWHFHSASGAFQTLSAFDGAMAATYGPPKNLEDYEAKAQAMTYAGERAMFEAYRRNQFASTGVIQWMLDNAWPSLFWHLYDYYLDPAGGYFGAKEANQPVHVQYSYDDRSVVVVNNLYRAFPAMTVTARVYDVGLKRLFSRRATVNVQENSSQRILVLPPFPKAPRPAVYFVKLGLEDAAGRTIDSNFYWLSSQQPVFEWNQTKYERTPESTYEDMRMLDRLPPVRLEASAARERLRGRDAVRVILRNRGAHLAFQVRVGVVDAKTGEPYLPVFWNDNYIELMPGESRTLTARYPAWVKLGAHAELEVAGWNIEKATLPLFPRPPAKPPGGGR